MAQYDPSGSGGPDDATVGVVGAPPTLPQQAEDGKKGFDYWLFALLAVVAILVSVQNLWLRRRARRESGEKGESS